MARRKTPAPLAIGIDGTLIANAECVPMSLVIRRLLEQLRREHPDIFLGVRLSPAQARELGWFIDGALHEGASWVTRRARGKRRSR